MKIIAFISWVRLQTQTINYRHLTNHNFFQQINFERYNIKHEKNLYNIHCNALCLL